MDRLRLKTQEFISRLTAKKLAVAALLYWLPVLIFLKLADDIWEQESFQTDSTFLHWLHSGSSPALDQWALHITNTGDVVAILTGTLVATILLVRWNRRRDATALVVGVGGAVFINAVLKLIFHRARPTLWHQIIDASGYSFPSGHAMMSSALALSIIVIAWHTRWKWPVFVVGGVYILLVGLSRMYLGVHFPTDVAAGWCVSLVWILIINRILGARPQATAAPA